MMKWIKVFFLFLSLPLIGGEVYDFEQLMGKGTPSWNFVQTAEDISRMEFFKKKFESNISLLGESSQTTESRIPKVIHFIWLGPEEIPKHSLKKMQEWMQLHPDWTFKFWTDIEDRKEPLPGFEKHSVQDFSFEELEECFTSCANLGEKAKILAYEILYREGGLYLDHDVKLSKPLDAFQQNYEFYCSLEELGPTCLSTSVYAASHLFAAKAHHPIIYASMGWLKENWHFFGKALAGDDKTTLFHRVKQRAFWALSAGIDKALGNSGNRDIVLASTFFSLAKRRATSYATHAHEGTWHQKNSPFEIKTSKQFQELIEKNNQTIILILSLSAISLCGWAFLWFYAKSMRKQHE